MQVKRYRIEVLGVSQVKMTGNRVEKTNDATYIPHVVCIWVCKTTDLWSGAWCSLRKCKCAV